MSPIDFRKLPLTAGGLSRLFNDYLYDFPKVRNFYASDFHSLGTIRDFIENTQKSSFHRAVLADVLLEQNKSLGRSAQTLETIELLRDEKTFCVVTGQQVGILGGPLYTLYKALTAVKVAGQLRALFPENNFLPIFWLEGEDHDFAEVNSVAILSQENAPARVEYLIEGKGAERNVGAVGELVFDSALETFLGQLENILPHSDFHTPVMEAVRDSYRVGRTFNQAFAHWVGKLCSDAGAELIFVYPNEKRFKQILSPVFVKELQEFPKTSQLVIDQSARLEKEYHAQIKPKAVNLFLFHNGGRYLIEPRNGNFGLKGTRHYPSREELLRIAAETPEQLSPNVVLRAICQDTLLPTVAYVAGPSEVAYFAQLKPVYEYYGVTMPTIYPRISATIVEQKIQSVLEKYGLELIDFFGHRERLNDRVVDLLSEVDLDELFSGTKEKIFELLGELKFGLNYIDPTMTGALETAQSKIESQLHILKEKASAAQRRKHETALRQIDKVANSVFPARNFQEREISIVHFMNKYGLDFPNWLANRLQTDVFDHQVVQL